MKGEGVESPNFAMAGFEWSLCIYPGGADSSDKGMIAVYIFNRSSAKALISYEISIMEIDGESYKKLKEMRRLFYRELQKETEGDLRILPDVQLY